MSANMRRRIGRTQRRRPWQLLGAAIAIGLLPFIIPGVSVGSTGNLGNADQLIAVKALLDQAAECRGPEDICRAASSGIANSAKRMIKKIRDACGQSAERGCRDTEDALLALNGMAERVDGSLPNARRFDGVAWVAERGRAPDLSALEAYVMDSLRIVETASCQGENLVCLIGKLEIVIDADQLLRIADPCARLAGDQIACRNKYVQIDIAIQSTSKKVASSIMDHHGWIDGKVWGDFLEGDLIVAIQHQDSDVGFQERSLARLKLWVEAGNANPARFAFLQDRVLVNRNLPQMYGSQGACEEGQSGRRWIPLKIADPDGVDGRRREVGLQPLDQYSSAMNSFCSE